ncbi:isocitrate dehydrogenase [NADP] cytoplasmic-like, partial [Dermacentor silvarum]|uniref:isocitrate dehydrogenase [NADP] cytoplasmic-like n=1 Tax=Dermacentor silvarum TaxID=543639 RepID=UPI0018975D32
MEKHMCGPVIEMWGDDMARVVWDLVRPPRRSRYNVGGVKCAIITAEKDVLEKCHLKRTWMLPNGAIRSALGGDVSRKPMVYRHIPPLVKQWRRPIIIARHAFSDQYNGQDFVVPGPGTLQIKYSPTVGASYNIH